MIWPSPLIQSHLSPNPQHTPQGHLACSSSSSQQKQRPQAAAAACMTSLLLLLLPVAVAVQVQRPDAAVEAWGHLASRWRASAAAEHLLPLLLLLRVLRRLRQQHQGLLLTWLQVMWGLLREMMHLQPSQQMCPIRQQIKQQQQQTVLVGAVGAPALEQHLPVLAWHEAVQQQAQPLPPLTLQLVMLPQHPADEGVRLSSRLHWLHSC